MELLKIATAGSVDDGKSTLIGRLLYETNSVAQDRLDAIMENSKRKGLSEPDLSLLTDGLVAEREQGITIDVAHIYFSTAKRKYIIADTPGHFEYTRNMVTGASGASVSLILADASRGLKEQSLRHFYIANILRIPHVIVCVNKMDLANYNKSVFDEIKETLLRYASKLDFKPNLKFIPISSLKGENITVKSDKMEWFEGACLLDELESISPKSEIIELPARFRVQSVIRVNNEQFPDYRAFAGKLLSGKMAVGDEIIVQPSQLKARIQGIEKGGNKQEIAFAGESINLLLDKDIDAGRDSLICDVQHEISPTKNITAQLCWFDNKPAQIGEMYLIGHGTKRVRAKLVNFIQKTNVESLEKETVDGGLRLNEIAEVEFRTAQELTAEPYAQNKTNGAFILIDEHSNQTAAMGLLR